MEREHLKSTSVKSAAYDHVMQILEVEFTSGDVYRYYDVSPLISYEFFNADSHGQYLNKKIKNAYEFQRLN